MTEKNTRAQIAPQPHALRRKQLYFRSCQRGQKELDILFARFARQVLPRLAPTQFAEYQALLDIPNHLLLAWVLAAEPVPPALDQGLLKQFLHMTRRARRKDSL